MVSTPNFMADPGAYLNHFLPADYLPPYGTPITPETFITQVDTTNATCTVRIATSDGGSQTYVLHLAALPESDGRLTARCEDPAGKPVDYLHPHTKRSARWAPVEDWYDFFLAKDAEARQEAAAPENIWDRNDVEGQLYRVSSNIVSFGETSANTANFGTDLAFQEWLNAALPHSPATFLVLSLTDREQFMENTKGTLMCTRLNTETDDPRLTGGSIPDSLNLPGGVPASWHDVGEEVPCEVSFDFEMDGHEFTYFHGDFMTFFSWVADCFHRAKDRPSWFGITPVNLGALLPVPSQGAVVTIRYDRDGAYVSVDVACEESAARKHQLEETYQRRWGRWLDENIALTDQELAAGVREIEAALQDRWQRETTGEVTYGRAH